MSQRKNTSEIWDYFEKVERDGKAVCKTCKESYSFKTTTANLKNHLKRKHVSLSVPLYHHKYKSLTNQAHAALLLLLNVNRLRPQVLLQRQLLLKKC